MMVVGLDIASRTGWAIGDTNGLSVRASSTWANGACA